MTRPNASDEGEARLWIAKQDSLDCDRTCQNHLNHTNLNVDVVHSNHMEGSQVVSKQILLGHFVERLPHKLPDGRTHKWRMWVQSASEGA